MKTGQYQILQKTAAEEYQILHPETDASVVLLASQKITATNVKDALEELKGLVEQITGGGVVTGVKGSAEEEYRMGNVEITKANIGLDKVENTSDLEKPISTATSAALAKKADKTEIADFITKAVTDLVNYYTKSEIDTKYSTLEGLISAVPKFAVSVVENLPQSGDAATIYLVKGSTSEDKNMYVEYIWVNAAWEKLGEQKLDLTGYAKEDWVNTQIADFVSDTDMQAAITSALTPYAKTADLADIATSGNLADANEDATHRLVTDTDKENWNGAKTAAETANIEIDEIKSGTTVVKSAEKAASADKLAAPVTIELTTDVTGSASTDGSTKATIKATLSDTGVEAGSYSAVTVDKKGRVSAGGIAVEVGESGQESPSEKLVIGGLFFKALGE